MNILSIDIGGTTTKIALINDNGEILNRYPAIKSFKGHNLSWLFDYINTINDEFEYIGIDIPGFYNDFSKEIVLSGNLEYHNFKIHDECKKYTSKEVYILNDANAAALGEYWKIFDTNKIKNVLFYVMGTGLGGAIIIDTKLYTGAHGYAGEFGHGKILDYGKCTCGSIGCIEPYVSGKGLTKYLNEHYNQSKALIEIKKQKNIELPDIKQLIISDSEVIELIKKALQPLIKHISIHVLSLDPQAIIIGGGPSQLGDPFVKLIRDELLSSIPKLYHEHLLVSRAICGNDAALFGNVYNILKSKKII